MISKEQYNQKELSQVIEEAIRNAMEPFAGKRDITLQEATKLIAIVEEQAIRVGVKAVIAIYNTGARPVAVHCMDDSYIASYDVAINKAYTSVALKMPTSQLKTLSQPGASLYGIQNTNEGKIVIFGGGEPLFHKETFIGAIGVSGGTETLDTGLAEFGKDKLKEVVSW